MEKYFRKLIEDYEKFLLEELGEGNLKKRMINKLEEILSGKTLKGNSLDKPFDFESIIKQNHNLGVRIRHCLKAREIETYRDLQIECYNYGIGSSWKNEKTYSNYLESFRSLGQKSAENVVSYLKSINFDFSEESAKKAFEENKSSL